MQATEPIETRQEQIGASLQTLNEKITLYDSKVALAGEALDDIGSEARKKLAAEIEEDLTRAYLLLGKKRDELLAIQQFDKVSTKTLSIVDSEGRRPFELGLASLEGRLMSSIL